MKRLLLVAVVVVAALVGVVGFSHAQFAPTSEKPKQIEAPVNEAAIPPTSFPKEWCILEKIPTGKGLAIGVFLFQEGMPVEHIHSVFGKPQEIITLDIEEGSYGTILVYPHHHFFFSKARSLQDIKERNVQTVSTVK